MALVGVPKQKKTHRGVNDQQQGDQDDGVQHGRQRSQQGGQGTFKRMNVCLEEKTTSIQSYIQPLINKDNDQSKSPYTTTGTVKRVQQKLINIGLKI